MALLKEDGSLDIERINNLPFEEHTREISKLTQEQYREYISKIPINESCGSMGVVDVEYTLEEDIERNGLVNADEMFNNIRKKYGM